MARQPADRNNSAATAAAFCRVICNGTTQINEESLENRLGFRDD